MARYSVQPSPFPPSPEGAEICSASYFSPIVWSSLILEIFSPVTASYIVIFIRSPVPAVPIFPYAPPVIVLNINLEFPLTAYSLESLVPFSPNSK